MWSRGADAPAKGKRLFSQGITFAVNYESSRDFSLDSLNKRGAVYAPRFH